MYTLTSHTSPYHHVHTHITHHTHLTISPCTHSNHTSHNARKKNGRKRKTGRVVITDCTPIGSLLQHPRTLGVVQESQGRSQTSSNQEVTHHVGSNVGCLLKTLFSLLNCSLLFWIISGCKKGASPNTLRRTSNSGLSATPNSPGVMSKSSKWKL